jgi:D-amino-acid dehydrogenase
MVCTGPTGICQAAPKVQNAHVALSADAKIVSSRLGRDRFRIAGKAEFNGFNTDIRADRIAPPASWCERLFPSVPTSAIIPWAGLRPMTPTIASSRGPGQTPPDSVQHRPWPSRLDAFGRHR